MEKQKLIQLLYFLCDLFNFTIGLGVVVQSPMEGNFFMFCGLAFSIINTLPLIYSLTKRPDPNYQVR